MQELYVWKLQIINLMKAVDFDITEPVLSFCEPRENAWWWKTVGLCYRGR